MQFNMLMLLGLASLSLMHWPQWSAWGHT